MSRNDVSTSISFAKQPDIPEIPEIGTGITATDNCDTDVEITFEEFHTLNLKAIDGKVIINGTEASLESERELVIDKDIIIRNYKKIKAKSLDPGQVGIP